MNALESIFRAVCDTSWRMAGVILVFLALRPLFRRRVAAGVWFWVWIAVAVRLLVPVGVPVKWSPFNLSRGFGLRAQPVASAALESTDLRAPEEMRSLRASAVPAPTPTARTRSSRSLSPVQCAASVWVAGVDLLLLRRINTHRRFVRRLQRPLKPGDAAQALLVTEATARLGATKVRVFVTDSVAAPALHGIFRPMLLFPPGLIPQLTPHEIQLVVAHELGHCHRRDLLAQALLNAARILHWFNPLAWIAAHAARHDCELACDEHVVRRLGATDPRVYGATLLKLLGLLNQPQPDPLGLGVVESKQQLKRRIQMIIAKKSSALTRIFLTGSLLVLVTGLTLTREARAEQGTGGGAPAVTDAAPVGWTKNGTNNAVNYTAGVDRGELHEGRPSAFIKSIKPTDNEFGGMMQMCSAANFTGKRLRFTASMKTTQANDGGAHLWFRVDGKEKEEILQFDNMDSRPVKGTTGWQPYSVVLDVPANATALAYGFFVSGAGQAWVSGVKIEEVGRDVPSTNIFIEKSRVLPAAPVNLMFE